MEENKQETTVNIPQPAQVEQSPKKKPGRKIYFILAAVSLILIALILFIFRPAPTLVPEKKPEKLVQTPLFLAIDSPKKETAVVNGEVLIEGRTLPNTTVVIYSDTDESSLESDVKGDFKDTVIVGDEGGLVRVTAFSDNGDELSKTIDLEDFSVLGKSDKASGGSKEDNTRGNSGNNSSKEDKGNEKREENAQNQNKIQNRSTEILTQTTPGVKSNKPQNVSEFRENKIKNEKPAKIGARRMVDILSRVSTTAAATYLGNNLKMKKMEAKQATSGATLKRHAVSGIIINISGGVITLAHQIQGERTYTIYINESTQMSMKEKNSSSSASLSFRLSAGMRIAVVGIPADGGLLATRIHVIPGKATGVFKQQPASSTSATPVLSTSPTGTESATPTASEAPTEVTASPSAITTP